MTTLVLAGARPLLIGALQALLEAEMPTDPRLADVVVDDTRPTGPSGLAAHARSLRGTARLLIVLVDPLGDGWLAAADDLRRDPGIALLVVAARPSYLLQRQWRKRSAPGAHRRATGMVSLNSRPDELLFAITASAQNPRDCGYWLHTDVSERLIPQHPMEHLLSEVGAPAAEVLRREDLHSTLVVASTASRTEAADLLSIEIDSLRGRIKRLYKLLDVTSDIGLGRRAAELGLFEDQPRG